MNKETAITLLKSCKTSAEWNEACDKIQEANGGEYPSWWFPAVILSGLASQVIGDGSDKINIES